MPDGPYSKALLRRQLRERRRTIGPAEQSAAAQAVALHITSLPIWVNADRIALYLARDGEIDTAPLTASCRAAGKQVFLPRIFPQNSLEFANWQEGEHLVTNRYGIPEPGQEAPLCWCRLWRWPIHGRRREI